MPRFDGTGPRGLGPMTGGGRGFCSGYYYSGPPIGLPSSYPRPTHKDCVNFKEGGCTLDNVAVDPNGFACPRFTPRTGVGQPYPPQIAPSYPSYTQYGYPPSIYPAATYPGYPQMPQYPTVPTAQMPPAPSLTKDQEKQMLEQALRALESQLDAMRKRLQELQGSQSP